MTKTTKWGTTVVLLAAVGAGGWALWRARRAADDAAQYRTETVDRGDVVMTVTATGTISPVTTVQVGSQVSGIIARLFADFNTPVHKGQLLAELDPTALQATVAQRQADVDRAEISLRNADVHLKRVQAMVDEKVSPQGDLDDAQAARDTADSALAQARAALDQARTNLGYTKIFSPVDGVVVSRQFDVGQTVAASFQAPTLFTIAEDLTQMQVRADVDQADIGRVAVGQKARFTVDAFPDREFDAEVSQIRLNATVNQNVVTYPVILTVANRDGALRPDMTADVVLEVARASDVLRVPNAALRFRPPASAAASGARSGRPGGAPAEASAARPSGSGGFAGRPGGGRGEGSAPGGSAAAASGSWHGEHKLPPGFAVVYKLGPAGALERARIHTGLTDGRYTEVKEGELAAGDAVVVGATVASERDSSAPAVRSPFGGRGRF
jgi:HlyD family secretion protein